MRKHRFMVSGFIFTLALLIGGMGVSAGESEEGFVKIFNGKNLEGWIIQGLEKAGPKVEEEGILKVGGWDYWAVITEKEYGDFILRFDVMLEARGNSGILIHPEKKDAFKNESFEIQLTADNGKVEEKCTGTLFTPKGAFKTPEKNPMKKIGEWNSVEIQYADEKLTLIINGEKVYDNLDMSQFDVVKVKEKGRIAIQRNDYKKAAFFKNIRVKELE